MSKPNQNVERQCSLCGKWRGLYQFSATQRKKGDDAACMRCIPEIQNVKPGHQKHDVDNSDANYIAVSARVVMNFTKTLLTASSQRTSTTASTTNGSLANKTGGVRLHTSAMSSAITAGTGNASVAGTGAPTHNGAASSAALSSRFSSTTNGNEPTPTYDVGSSGWVRIRSVRHINLPCLPMRLTSIS